MDGAVGERAQAIVQRTERNCPSKVTLLPLVVNGWHLGPVLSPGVTSGSQKTGCANRGLHVWTTGEITPSAVCWLPLRTGSAEHTTRPPW